MALSRVPRPSGPPRLPRAALRSTPSGAAGRAADPGRRRFLGYLVAAPTLAAAAELGLGGSTPAYAALPSGPQPPELYDLNDMLTDAARPTRT